MGAIRRSVAVRGSILLAAHLSFVTAACVPAEGEVVPLDHYRHKLEQLEARRQAQTIEVVDRDGTLLAEQAPDGHRIWLSFDEIPPLVRTAVVATEDRTFYSNAGVDKKAVARAVLQNAQAGDTVSGASTITMQLVRLVAFDGQERYEESIERKLREVHLAAELDERYSKDEILEFYLNVAYFGRGAYGIGAAARRFFGVAADDLTPAQAVFLAGLLQAPSALDPDQNFAGARERQRTVLERLISVGALEPSAADAIFLEPLSIVPAPKLPDRRADHFVDYVLEELVARLGPEAASGGFRIETTLDLELNDRLADIAARHIVSLREAHAVQDAAVVGIEPATGGILAMVGGVDYDRPGDGQVNVATSPRQPGSAFKPIAFAAALEEGWSPASLLWDVPYEFSDGAAGVYVPRNYDGVYHGPVRLRDALANSLNAASIGLAAEVGLDRVHAAAQRFGLPIGDDPWRYGLSLALGGAEVPLLDLTAAYGAFANGGTLEPPHAITRVVRLADGETVYHHRGQPQRIMSPETAWLISDILDDDRARRPAFGTGGPLELPEPSPVKTGTTNDYRDNLTVGYTPWLVLGVWAGNKDGQPMRDVLGITGAAPIWNEAMRSVMADAPLRATLARGNERDFDRPTRIASREICTIPTLRGDGTCQVRTEVFDPGSPSDDRQITFDWFVAQPGLIGRCDARSEPGRGSVRLLAPRAERVVDAARRWAAGRGVELAGPPCEGPADANSPKIGRMAVDAGQDVGSRGSDERLH